MTVRPDRWATVERVFHAAQALPVEQRASFLVDACPDEEIRREVESLLAQQGSVDDVLTGGAVAAAADLVTDPGGSMVVGRRFGVYHVLAPLGAGGMGEVYRARDTRLGRDVAIKILPREFTSDPERLTRFEREARILASLNHPNIATIYGVEDAEGVRAIVMELVEGDTLAARIARGVKVRDALHVARQIVDALDAAHAKGIVHRDLKPANVKITRGDGVKVLDFGLAKSDVHGAADLELTQSPTVTVDGTRQGLILGTAPYMSPEQVRGQAVDKRTDIWAFGCVLYEMLAGRSPFVRGTSAETLAAILERDPAWDALPAATPSRVVRLLRRCLEKDAARRLPEMSAARVELDAALQSGRVPLLSRATALVGASLVLLAAAAGGFWIFRGAAPPTESIAILPFVNVSGNQDIDYLSDGITESLINSLSQAPSLAVMSRNAVFRYKGPTVDAQEAGNALNVHAVLTGTVAQRGDDLVISTELVDVRNNRHLWGERYNRKLPDILAIQEEISSEISDRLRIRLTGEQKQRVAKQYTQNTDAYQLYLKGRYYWNKKTADGFFKGIDYFQQAIRVDSNYAPAYAGMAALYINLANYNFALIPPKEAAAKAKAAATRALQIDDTLAAAHTSAALVAYQWEWDWANADKEFKRAIALEPASSSTYEPTPSSTYHWYAHYLMTTGQVDASLRAGRRALEMDPLDLANNAHQGWHSLFVRQYDQAVPRLRQAIDLDPTWPVSQWYLGLAYEQQGAFADAIAQFQTCVRLTGERPSMLALLGHAYAAAGNRRDAQAVLQQLAALSSRAYVPAYPVAAIHAALGDKERAFASLEQAFTERDSWMNYLALDPRMDVLHSDSRFADLLRRMNLRTSS